MLLHVTDAEYLTDYTIKLTFNDGRIGTVNLFDTLVGPVFEPLKKISLFMQCKVDKELETLVWPNGADFAPEYLYFLAFQDIPKLQAQFQQGGYQSSQSLSLSCEFKHD